MPEPYTPRFQILPESWTLSDEQEAECSALESDIEAAWPDLTFRVAPARKMLRRGVLQMPSADGWFRVAYENGPLLKDVRKVIDGRCRGVNRIATTGAVLWVHAQVTWRGMLGGSGRVAIQPFDLTSSRIRGEIHAMDEWATKVGFTQGNASDAEGWETVIAAAGFARRTGVPCPTATDANVALWDWREPTNRP